MSFRQTGGPLALAWVLMVLAGALWAPVVGRAASATGPLVLTGSQATYSITSALRKCAMRPSFAGFDAQLSAP